MTPERSFESKKLVAKQEFDIEHVLHTLCNDLSPQDTLTEFIDNALDNRELGTKLIYKAHFDKFDRRIILEEESVSGMLPEDLDQFAKFGLYGKRRKEDDLGQHGFGGKAAYLWWMEDAKDSSVNITSLPAKSRNAFQMSIEDWWGKLDQGREWEITPLPNREYRPTGYTRFELQNVNEKRINDINKEYIKTTRRLGLVYGKKINDGEIGIKLTRIKRGNQHESIDVFPEVVKFDENDSQRVEKRSGPKGDGPLIEVTWGAIDIRQKEEDLKEIKRRYGNREKSVITGNNVYYYYRGRLVEIKKLSDLSIPEYRKRLGFENWAVVVDIVEGPPVDRNLFKTKISPSSIEGEKINHTVRNLIKDDVRIISQESERDRIKPKDRLRAQNAGDALHKALIEMYKSFNNIKHNLKLETIHIEKVKQKSEKRDLPFGRRKTYTFRKEEREKQAGQKSPIPEIDLAQFGDSSPEAQLEFLSDGNLIELNSDNQFVKSALSIRNQKESSLWLLRLALEPMVAHMLGDNFSYEKAQEEIDRISKVAEKYL